MSDDKVDTGAIPEIDMGAVLESCPAGGVSDRLDCGDDVVDAVDAAARAALDRLSARGGDGSSASDLGVELREVAILNLLRCMVSGSDSVALKAAEKVLDRSDGRPSSGVVVVDGDVGLSIGSRVIGAGDDNFGDVLSFIDRLGGGTLSRAVSEDVIDLDVDVDVVDISDDGVF